jgi:hypothetical protein
MDLFVLKITKNPLPAVTDSGESKIQPKATHIFDFLKMFLVSSTLHGWFFFASLSL